MRNRRFDEAKRVNEPKNQGHLHRTSVSSFSKTSSLAVTADLIRSLLHYVLPFLLDKKGRKNQGRHHRSQHTKRALPRHVGRAHAPYPVSLWRSQSETVVGHFCLSTASEPKASSRRNIRDPLRYRGTPPLYGIAGLRPR